TLDFDPDRYQVDALDAIADGKSVVVTAPTGAGKTLIADGAIEVAKGSGKRAFYTTPIKALSNQKFNDLRAVHGDDAVGLLTGDNVINGDAPIVVMTTEVIRNMIYDDAAGLADLGVVVLDEVHYLADRHRGSVWEEVIIHLDRSVQLVCLSATIANPEEFTGWVEARRGQTTLVVESHRPVPLTSMYMWNDRASAESTQMQPVFGRNGRPNSAVANALQRSKGRHKRFRTPRRTDVVEELFEAELLPAIYFMFSRKGCDQAARQIATGGLHLTTSDDRKAIRSVVGRHVANISPEDLSVLGYASWLDTLLGGAAPHHAGLVPAFKEAAEELFLAGLLQVVVATETLALGINMPARTVVLDSLSKFNGESHELLQPSDYTQLTGRAGRRGIDDEGTAVVLYSQYVPFDRVAGIAAAGSNPLNSSFAPTYNMTVNLIARYDESSAHELLRASFANFRDDTRTARLVDSVADRERDLETFQRAATCHLGDIWDVAGNGEWPRQAAPNNSLLDAGAVMDIGPTRYVLLSRSWGGPKPRLDLVDASGRLSRIRVWDLPRGTSIAGSINLPKPVRTADTAYRNEAAQALERFIPEGEPAPYYGVEDGSPVLTCPDLEDHLQWVDKARRAERDLRRLRRRASRSDRSDILVEFDRLHEVLNQLNYTDGWSLLPPGQALRRLYNELDLLLSEVLESNILAGLEPAEFGAVLSVFTYESRGGIVPQHPRGEFAQRPLTTILAMWDEVVEIEKAAGLEGTRPPDVGLVDTLHGWGGGFDLEELFDDEDVRAGDFVRAARQTLDLLRQVRDGYPAYREVASRAIEAIDRGIVDVDVL
ncbi:MAG: DEAD/DEAH box helicase, partial [Acidimicrobiia bacterium]